MARGRPSKKQLILDTARALFAEKGYQGTSIDLVVKQAGVSKPTVYNNFKTKQALLFALMEALSTESEAFCEDLWQQNDLAPAEGIIAAFKNIANTPALLAVYRICYGESHKLEQETYQQFKQFDNAPADYFEKVYVNDMPAAFRVLAAGKVDVVISTDFSELDKFRKQITQEIKEITIDLDETALLFIGLSKKSKIAYLAPKLAELSKEMYENNEFKQVIKDFKANNPEHYN